MRRWPVVAVIVCLAGCGAANTRPGRDVARDRAAAPAGPSTAEAWEPGDPIPGWDDFPCPELTDDYMPVDVPYGDTLVGTVGGCVDGQCSVEQPSWIRGDFYDSPDGMSSSTTQFVFDINGSLTPRNPRRAQGWYHSSFHSGVFDRTAFTFLRVNEEGSFVDQAYNDSSGYEYPTQAWICLSRVRPDEVAGVAWIRPYRGDRSFYWDGPKVTFRVPFDVILPDNASVYVEDSYPVETYPWFPGTGMWSYYHDQEFGTAWPWHEITDPALRTTYMDRYRPYVDLYGPP